MKDWRDQSAQLRAAIRDGNMLARAKRARRPAKYGGGPIPESAIVVLTRAAKVGDRVIPAGSKGTVVHVYPDGVAYEVEFSAPYAAVATIERNQVEEDAAALAARLKREAGIE